MRAYAAPVATIVLTGLAAPAATGAIAWDYVPVVSTGAVYDTNPRYAVKESEKSALGAVIDARVALTGQTETQNFSLTPRLRSNLFFGSNNSALDANDLYLSAVDSWKGIRNEFDVRVDLDRVGTRNTEFIASIPDQSNPNPPPGSGHLVSLNEFQRLLSVAPEWSYVLTDHDSLDVAFDYANVSYNKAIQTGRFNYWNSDGSVTLRHAFTARSSVLLTVNGSIFRASAEGSSSQPDIPSTIENDTDSYGGKATYQYALSDTLNIGVTGGGTISNVSIASPIDLETRLNCVDPASLPQLVFVRCHSKTSAGNFVGEVFVKKRSSQTTSNVSIGRTISPNSQGSTVTQDTFNAFVIHDITAQLNGSIGFTAFHQTDVANLSAFKRDYVRTDLALSWRLAPSWSVRGSYAYTLDKQNSQFTIFGLFNNSQSTTARDNYVFLEIQWQGLGHH